MSAIEYLDPTCSHSSAPLHLRKRTCQPTYQPLLVLQLVLKDANQALRLPNVPEIVSLMNFICNPRISDEQEKKKKGKEREGIHLCVG